MDQPSNSSSSANDAARKRLEESPLALLRKAEQGQKESINRDKLEVVYQG